MKLKINKYFWNVIFVIQITLLTMILFFINRNKILITKRNVLFFIGLALLIIISFVLIQMPLMNKTAKRKVLMGKIISFLLSLLLFFYGYQLIMEVLSV